MLTMEGCTNLGQRTHNEDCFATDPDHSLALVADGMGGYASGEVASQIVAHTLLAELADGNTLSGAISRSHHEVKQAAADGRGGAGMGAAVVAIAFEDYDYEICWVGDCRAYLWDGELRQITRDHSYVESLLARGLINWEEAEVRPDRNLITQAVGATEIDVVDVGSIRGSLTQGEELLLCSDGLNDVLRGRAIADILNSDAGTAQRCAQLVGAAADAGGKDNITALLITPDAQAPDGPVDKPAAISISRLDGSVEYFTIPNVNPATELADTKPLVDEFGNTGIHIPKANAKIDYNALEEDLPRVSVVGSVFFRNILLGLGGGAIVAALVLAVRWAVSH